MSIYITSPVPTLPELVTPNPKTKGLSFIDQLDELTERFERDVNSMRVTMARMHSIAQNLAFHKTTEMFQKVANKLLESSLLLESRYQKERFSHIIKEAA